MPTIIGNLITLDGQFTDWPTSDALMTPGNTVAGYQVYGTLLNDTTLGNTYVIGINATGSDPVIGPNSFIYLNTDQNTSTGYSPFGAIGAEYYVQFAVGSTGALQPFLYSVTSAGVATQLNGGAPLSFGLSSNGQSVEIAIPQSLVTPTGGAAPHSINVAALINNGAAALPSDFTKPEYVVTDPSTLVPVDHTVKKVAIVYSATTAALYFGGSQAGQTAYADLFMAAQHQAEAAGVSYDILSEADLTNVAKMAQYSALIFPSMEDVQSSQAAAIENALSQVVYNYHVPIITAGNFMTNDQTGAPLAGNSYANMQALLDLTLGSSGTATFSVTADPTALANHNPIVNGYTAGQLIGGASGQFAGTTQGLYTNTGYLTFSGLTHPATVLADINIQGGSAVAGVVQTTTGGTNTHFATTALLGDSNLLQHAIQNAVFGTTPSLTIDITRMAGVVDSRTDLDQSQFPSDVSPGAGQKGIYDALLPMLQQWKQQYNFVGSFYANVGDNANPANENSTNWAVSAPYYKAIIAMGSEIGSHSLTHLINPPTVDANGNPVPTILVQTQEGPQTINSWDENTNSLYVTPPANGSAPNWTFAYEFGQSNTLLNQNLGIKVAGAAVPGANDTIGTSAQILQYYPSAGGLTGYVNGGWTGAGSGYPNAFGYIDPTHTGSVYIAPNITFDFTEIQFQHKTPTQALADWESLFNQLSANSGEPVIVWPWHDYGPTNWPTSGPGTTPPGYTAQMYADFIAYAANAGYEFVTSEDLASRIAAQQKATLSETTSGNVITATITPDPSAPDLGAMALNVVNGAAGQVIQNAGTWYAYDTNSIFLPFGGGTFNVTLGTTQDDVTHIDALPMRADLKSVTGDGSNLTFSMTGDGVVDVHVKTPGANIISIQGAPAATLNADDLSLTFNDGALALSSTSPEGVPVLHNVTITDGPNAVTSSGNDIIFAGTGNETISTGDGNDIIHAGQGNDTIDGGAGIDTVVFSAAHTAFTFTSLPGNSLRVAGPQGTDTVTNVEQLTFSDVTMSVIEAFGSTLLAQVGSNYFLDPVVGATGPELMYGGAAFVAGSTFGAWAPIGAEAISGGYEVAFKIGSNSYTIWDTDASGNITTNVVPTTSGSNASLEALETSFHQDLNGDGTIGVPVAPGSTVIEAFGSTELVQTGSNYFLSPVTGGTGPELKYGGPAFIAGSTFGAWAPIGAEAISGGYEVAFKFGSNTYTVWNTDASGNITTNALPTTSGSNASLEALENSFHQDLNGDGIIGVPVAPGSTAIEAFGSTELVRTGSNYFLDPVTGGTGPELKYGGAAFVAGSTFGAWAPIGAEAISGGYEVAFKLGSNTYTIWNTDASGNITTNALPTTSGSSLNLESLESSFHQDLNGDHLIGIPPSALTGSPSNTSLTGGPGSDTFVFAPINSTITNGVYVAGFGQDVVTNFNADATSANHDVLQLASSMFAQGTTVSSIMNGTAHNLAGGPASVVQQNSNVVITVDPTDTITMNNVLLSVLKANAAADIHLA